MSGSDVRVPDCIEKSACGVSAEAITGEYPSGNRKELGAEQN
jgi:hypothetical protein